MGHVDSPVRTTFAKNSYFWRPVCGPLQKSRESCQQAFNGVFGFKLISRILQDIIEQRNDARLCQKWRFVPPIFQLTLDALPHPKRCCRRRRLSHPSQQFLPYFFIFPATHDLFFPISLRLLVSHTDYAGFLVIFDRFEHQTFPTYLTAAKSLPVTEKRRKTVKLGGITFWQKIIVFQHQTVSDVVGIIQKPLRNPDIATTDWTRKIQSECVRKFLDKIQIEK